MKTSPVYIVLYIQLAIIVNFILFFCLKILYNISILPLINDVFGPLRDYTLGDKQPIMYFIIKFYELINMRPLHILYLVVLCIIIFLEIVVIVCWMIGLILRNIIFTNPFANIPPWNELDQAKFFDWFFEKTGFGKKNEDVARFILNIFRSILTPEEYAAAEKRCIESFVGKGSSGGGSGGGSPTDAMKIFAPPAPAEHIDYNFENKYEEEKREKDIFYRNSYLSIKQRSDANSYRNMTIARPDIVATIPELPDIENIIKAEVNYVNIKLG